MHSDIQWEELPYPPSADSGLSCVLPKLSSARSGSEIGVEGTGDMFCVKLGPPPLHPLHLHSVSEIRNLDSLPMAIGLWHALCKFVKWMVFLMAELCVVIKCRSNPAIMNGRQ